MNLRSILLLCALCCATSSALSQTIDPYRRLTDPRAITYLDGDDAEPLRYTCFVGWPSTRDESDQYFVLASGQGAGILTHIWMQLQDKPDSVTQLKIYIDDSLVASDHLYSFFKRPNGQTRPPFDSLQSGGLVCDVQMPFKRNFKITYYAGFEHCCLFWAVGWRPVRDPARLEAFSLSPSSDARARQQAAEEVYWSGESPWKGTSVATVKLDQTVTINDPIEREITGPGLITELQFKPSSYDADALRNLWMELYWDGSPTPSVNVPLADFFGAGAGMRDVRSHPIRVEKQGRMTSYFPMPFAVKARMRIVNRSTVPIDLAISMQYSREPIDRERMGYFEAQFNEKKGLRYHVYHPVGYHQGRGRFVGMQLYLPEWQPGYFLEGDPLFHIDSSATSFIRYTGSEDYFNGGWFFSDGPFSLPFAGCTELHTSLYRFHYMDAIDYKESFQLLLQHGTRNDFKAWYRTVAYFYNQWTPFWTVRDTIMRSETLTVSGTGYSSEGEVTITIDSVPIAALRANAQGEFSKSLIVNPSIALGGHVLAVNGVPRPEPLWITEKPDVYFVRDTFPNYVNWKDTVTVYGTGFNANERVSIYLDTTEAGYSSPVNTDANGQFVTKILIPQLADGDYHIVARTDAAHSGISTATLHHTRTYNLEIENMWPPVIQEGHAAQDYMGYFPQEWSEQYYLLFLGEVGKRVAVKFDVPLTDTFAVSAFATKGIRFGDYRITLDNVTPVIFNGFELRDFNDPIRSGPIDLGTHFLAAGPHFLTFECIGKDANATEYLLGADDLVLRPVTAFQPPLASMPRTPLRLIPMVVYPNPVKTLIQLYVGRDTSERPIDVEVVDVLGIVRARYRSLVQTADGVIVIYVGELAPGHYQLRLSANGNDIGHTSFVKTGA